MHFPHYSLRIKISFTISFQCSLKLLILIKSSMGLSSEFHGTFWKTFEQHLWFHGIPWNLSNKTSSYGILSRSKDPWNSMELFPYSRVPWYSMELFISPKKFPWNSMEFHGTFLKFHEIPWNWINLIFYKKNHISKYCCWRLIDD